MKSRLPAAALTFIAALLFTGLPTAHAAVVTYIDMLTNPAAQIISTNNATVTNTVPSTSAIGAFRTLVLDTKGGSSFGPPPGFLGVDGSTARLILLSGDATNNFSAIWAGADGTSGFAPVDFTGGLGTNFSLLKSTLNFSVLNADVSSPFTWTFRDASTNTATFSGTLTNTSSPGINYAISLASFNPSSPLFDWSSVNFISLSGGGYGLDLTLSGAISVTAQSIPEPGTWAAAGLLLLTAVYIRWRRSRGAVSDEEAPASA
jgi:hypothetical protein